MVIVTLCTLSPLMLEMLSLHPSNLPLSLYVYFSVPPVYFYFPVRTPLCFYLTSPQLLFPAPLCPESPLSVVVLCFDICVYLAAVCSAGSRTDRAGLNKERKLGKGNSHTHTQTHIQEHTSRNTSCNGRILTAPYCRQAHTYPPCMSELGLSWPQHTTSKRFTKFFFFLSDDISLFKSRPARADLHPRNRKVGILCRRASTALCSPRKVTRRENALSVFWTPPP